MVWCLALEGGGTRTRAGIYEDERLVSEAEAGPSNPMAYGLDATAAVIAELAARLVPDNVSEYHLVAGIAGVLCHKVAEDLVERLAGLPKLAIVTLSTDLHPLLLAHVPNTPGILAIAGTGASILTHDGKQHYRRFGGRGPIMGDGGSGYKIGVAALRAAAHAVDSGMNNAALVTELPKVLGLPNAEALVPWSLSATKQEIAALVPAIAVFADEGDVAARDCIEGEAIALAQLIDLACNGIAPTVAPVPLFLQGGVVEHSAIYRRQLRASLEGQGTQVHINDLHTHGHEAVLALRNAPESEWCHRFFVSPDPLAPTEGQSDAVPPIDTMDIQALVDTMVRHESHVGDALRQQAKPLAKLTDAAGSALRSGGRIIYVGAGTSGRLGVLDASECPPTFGTDPRQVVGIIAGGEAALRTGVEGAEDDREKGVADLKAIGLDRSDIVIGIAASGSTPYVLAALEFARSENCTTALLCCNPRMGEVAVEHRIALPTGPEALPGSTRLNAGTATKVALNIISTGAMAQSGYVYRGQMVKMRASNTKLRARAVRMLSFLTANDDAACKALLETVAFDIPIALLMMQRGIEQPEAERLYAIAKGNLPDLLEFSLPT